MILPEAHNLPCLQFHNRRPSNRKITAICKGFLYVSIFFIVCAELKHSIKTAKFWLKRPKGLNVTWISILC